MGTPIGNWANNMLDHACATDPAFACQARAQLRNMERTYSSMFLSSPLYCTPFPPCSPAFPIYCPCPPIFGPSPRQAWTPMISGAPSPNPGIRGLADLPTCRPVTPAEDCGCGCGGLSRCRAVTWYNPLPPPPPSEPPCRPSTPAGGCRCGCGGFNSRRLRTLSNPLPPPPRPSSFTPRHIPGTPPARASTPFRLAPDLPSEPPSMQQWTYETGDLSWTPRNNAPPSTPSRCSTPANNSHCDYQVTHWLRGHPEDEQPHIKWDISKSPHHAEWQNCGPNSIQRIFDEDATIPTSSDLYITINNPVASHLWGTIRIKNNNDGVSVWQILNSIYEHFTEPITRSDLDYLQSLDSSNHAVILDAARRRVNASPDSPAFEATRGMKRVDILGDKRRFWGLSVTQVADGWYLNVAFK